MVKLKEFRDQINDFCHKSFDKTRIRHVYMIYIHNHTLTIIFYAYFRNPNHFVLRNELQEDDSVLFKGENTLSVKNRTKLG